MDISVITVTYNSQKTIKDCLTSILDSSPRLEVIVVDNGSTDETLKIIKNFGDKIKLIEAGANLGFSKANNLGVKKASNEYLVFLNPDTKVFNSGDLDKLVQTLKDHPEYGVIGPKLVYSNGEVQVRTRNLPTIIRAVKEYWLGEKGTYDFYQPKPPSLSEVESLIGACMVIKKDLFLKIGGFNEKYFMYYEDLEICKMVRSLGFKVGFMPKVIVEHAEGVSGLNQKTNQFLHNSAKEYHGLINYFLIQFVIKLANAWKYKKKLLLTVFLIAIASSVFRLSNLDLIEFKKDEALTVYQTMQFYKEPYLVERGLISGIGVYNFPFFNYLIIILAVFSRDPMFLSFFIALINVFLTIIFYLIIKKYYDNITAIFGAFILSFAPWGIMFSRKIWAQDLILLFLIPLLGLIHNLILKKDTHSILPIFILLAFLGQLHGSGIFFAAATILIFLILRININIKSALLGILIGLIPVLPYVIFQLTESSICPDCQAFTAYQNSIRSFDPSHFYHPFQSIFGLGYHFVLGSDYNEFIKIFPIVEKLKYLYLAGFLIPLIGVYQILFKRRDLIFIVMYLAIIPILYFLTKTQGFMHYHMTTFLLMILLYAISFNFLYQIFKSNFIKALTILVFSIFIIANIIFTFSFYQFVSLKQNIAGDYGPIYRLTQP